MNISKNGVKLKARPRFNISSRMNKLIQRSRELALSGKRNLYTADETQLLYHWTDKCNAIAPQSGEFGFSRDEVLALGDHACRVDLGIDFPRLTEVPSRVEGYSPGAESWGRDYAFLLDNSPAEIYPYENIVGEFHWEMNEIRKYDFGDRVHEMGRKAREYGVGGTSHGHTCPDLSIGLSQGWGGILDRINDNLAKYARLDNRKKVTYLRGAKLVCEAIIRYIGKYACRALELAGQTRTNAQYAPNMEKMSVTQCNSARQEQSVLSMNKRERYLKIAKACRNISTNPPGNFYEAVQWIQFAVMTDRIVGHGNGYGRLDQYLIGFYTSDISKGMITREEAREYLAEMFLKLRGQFFSLGGRKSDHSDATNEVSWIVMEAYDMIDDYNNLGVMWHPDMDREFYDYTCDVLARHGAGIPSLVNYDLIRDAELRSGVSDEDAYNVAYSGCQWFCIPGREYCDQDVNAIVLIDPMKRAIDKSVNEMCSEFEQLYEAFVDELRRTCEVLREFKDAQYEKLPDVWPEIATSLNCHGTIERGLDITSPRGVDYQFTSTNILGIPNVADSLFAIKKLVFEQKRYTLAEIRDAVSENWLNREEMRQRFLSQDKYGNDIDEVDSLYVRITETIAEVMDNMYNNRGQQYRASLFHFQGHTVANLLGATPDGRLAEEPLAHGCNPTAGRSTNGLFAVANSLAKVDNRKFLGGSMQIELQPKFFDGRENIYTYVRDFSEAFFRKGGVQINLNIMDLSVLKDAISHPEKPEYRNIIVKVTGYTSRFITLSKVFQKEFVGRENYDSM